MGHMVKVFLSSTFRDLIEHRAAATAAINGSPHCHCVRMEDFPPDGRRAADYCRERVRECSVFIGILGLVYGSSPDGDDRSYTELEYDEALQHSAHCCMFVSSDEFALPGRLREDDVSWAKQQAFRERVTKSHVCKSFTSPDGLAATVSQALAHIQSTAVPHSSTQATQPTTAPSVSPTSSSISDEPPPSDGAAEVDYLIGGANLQGTIDDLRTRADRAALLGQQDVAADLSARAARLEALLPVVSAGYDMVIEELLDVAVDSCGDMSVSADPDEFIERAPEEVLQGWVTAKQTALFEDFTLYLVADIPDPGDEFIRIHGGYVLGRKGDHHFWVASWW